MKLKLYIDVMDLEKSVEYYSKIFDAPIVKPGKMGYHGSVNMFGQQSLLLHKSQESSIADIGSFIIRLEDNEMDLFEKVLQTVTEDKNTEMVRKVRVEAWGTTWFEFRDINGYRWDIEINNEPYRTAHPVK